MLVSIGYGYKPGCRFFTSPPNDVIYLLKVDSSGSSKFRIYSCVLGFLSFSLGSHVIKKKKIIAILLTMSSLATFNYPNLVPVAIGSFFFVPNCKSCSFLFRKKKGSFKKKLILQFSFSGHRKFLISRLLTWYSRNQFKVNQDSLLIKVFLIFPHRRILTVNY